VLDVKEATQVAFDGAGDLVVDTAHAGVSIYPPGATVPARRIPGANGPYLAVDAAGDIATAGDDRDQHVHIYPGGDATAGYTVPGHVPAGGLAFAPSGDLAVADMSLNKINVYAHGATNVARTESVLFGTRLVAYDHAGHLAAASTDERTLFLFQPSPAISLMKIEGFMALAIAFDSTGRLLIGTPNGVQPFKGSTPQTALRGLAANFIAADSDGRFAAGDPAAGLVAIYSGEERMIIGGLTGIRGMAFSP
jgi:hypothetical protein